MQLGRTASEKCFSITSQRPAVCSTGSNDKAVVHWTASRRHRTITWLQGRYYLLTPVTQRKSLSQELNGACDWRRLRCKLLLYCHPTHPRTITQAKLGMAMSNVAFRPPANHNVPRYLPCPLSPEAPLWEFGFGTDPPSQ